MKHCSYFLLTVVFFMTALPANSQTSLPLNTIVTQNFNSIGNSSMASLPSGWKMSAPGNGNTAGYTTPGNATAVTQAASSGNPATGGAYNWATSGGADRSIGFKTSGTYTSPNSIMAFYRNTTGAAVSSFTVAFAVERYIINTSTVSVAFFSSTDGNTWTAQPAGDISTADFPTGANVGTFSFPKTLSKIVTVNVTVPDNGDIYFRWVFTNTGSTNAQGLGLDDVSVFAGPPTPVVIANLRDILQVDNGTINQFNEGDVIRYQTVIKNTGTGNANNVQLTLPSPPANTTMVGGSVKTSAVAVDDNYTTSFNTDLNGASVLINDVGIPLPTAVLSFGPTANAFAVGVGSTGSSNAGGILTVNADGTFSYSPPFGFSGIDQFKYITGNGNLPNNDAIVSISVAPDISFTTMNTDPLCNGSADGTITFNASGGNGVLMYSVTGAGGTYQSSPVFNGLPAASYNLAVKDAGGYIKTGITTLNNPTIIVVSGTIPNLIYTTAMATASFTKTGGTGSVSWSATGLPSGMTINSSTGDVTGSPTQTGSFTAFITATDVNGCTGFKGVSFTVAPKLSNDAYTAVGNTQLVSNGAPPSTPFTADATNILSNDASNVSISVTAGTFVTTNGGSITIDAFGRFTYTPLNGSVLADSYTYTATSGGVSATATINFTVSNMIWYVNNTYGGANGPANGSSHRPYTDVAAAAGASAVNQIIYVHTGMGGTNGNALLKAGQTLRGSGSALSVGGLSIASGTKPTLTGTITLANNVNADGFDMNTAALPAFTNAGVTVTGVTVNVGNVTTTTGTGINITGTGNNINMTLAVLNTNSALNAVNLLNTDGSVTINGGNQINSTGSTILINGGTESFTYTGNISQAVNAPMVSISGGHSLGIVRFFGTLTATNGTGLQFDNADASYNFNGTTDLNGGDAGIDILNGSSGAFTFSAATSITNPLNEVIKVTNSSAGINYSGSFTKNNNSVNGIFIRGETSGSINFNGNGTKILSTGSANAVDLSLNVGASVNFNGNNLSITTTSGTGFSASSSGTIGASGTGNVISSTTGTALIVTNTTISVSGLIFKSISAGTVASGPANGIVLNNTGLSGCLTITGNGSPGTGGTIQKTTANALSFTSTSNIDISYLVIQNSVHDGINGSNITNLSLSNCQVLNNGSSSIDNGIHLIDLSGTVSFTGNTVTGSYQNNVWIDAGAGSTSSISTLSVTGGSYSNSLHGQGFLIILKGTAAINTGLVSNATFSGNFSSGLQVASNENSTIGNGAGAPATGTFTVNNCVFTNNGAAAADFDQGGSNGAGNVYVRFINNLTITGNGGPPINVFSFSTATGGTLKARIEGNHVGNAGIANSGSTMGPGIRVVVQGRTVGTVTILNNIVRQTPGSRGIDVEALGPVVLGLPITSSDISIVGNDVNNNDATGFALDDIYIAADNQGSPAKIRAEIHGNITKTGAGCADYPGFSGNEPWLYFNIRNAGSQAQLFNFSGKVSVNAELAATNTGSNSSNAGVSLTATAINIVQ